MSDDVGPPQRSEAELLRSLLAGLGDMIVAFDETGTMRYANLA